MDKSNWKRVLFQWANRCCSFENNYYNLEQTDIDEFFSKYCERLTEKLPIQQNNIATFLKEQYPEFELYLSDDNQLSSSDYMYVYSILLHYSCVKRPDKYFHQACEELYGQLQISIANFLTALLNKQLTKENIRHAISEASPKTLLTFATTDSPNRNPNPLKESPPTPKTSLLEEKQKQLNSIKAMLDTERYEKGFLEIQLKQYEEKINKLTKDQNLLKTEIKGLKVQLLAKCTENSSPTRNLQDEKIKKRLRKEISEKEDEIYTLKSSIEQLQEEKNLINSKLKYSRDQVTASLGTIKEMDNTINVLKLEIEQKDEEINVLRETKKELEQFINESIGNNRNINGRDLMNTSGECLDTSLSRTSSSGNSGNSSICFPENLGPIYVDIKVREKENEIRELREQIEKIQTDNNKLVEHIYELLCNKYSQVFDINEENSFFTINKNGEITDQFMIFESYVQKLSENYLNSCNTVKSMQNEIDILNSQKKQMDKRIKEIEEILQTYEKQISIISKEKDNLFEEHMSLMATYNQTTQQLHKAMGENAELKNQIQELNAKFDQIKDEKEFQRSEFTEKLKEKEIELDERKSHIETLKEKIEHQNQKIFDSESENKLLSNEKREISLKIENLTKELIISNQSVQELNARNNSLQNEMQTSIQQLTEEVKKLTENVYIKDDTVKLLANELNISNEKNQNLTEQIEQLKNIEISLSKELKEANNQLESLKQSYQKIEIENDKINIDFKNYRSSTEIKMESYENENQKLLTEFTKHKEIAAKELEISKQNILILEKQIEEMKQRITELSSEISEKEILHENMKATIEILKIEKNTIQEDMQQKEEILQKKIEMLEEKNKIFDREIDLIILKLEEETKLQESTKEQDDNKDVMKTEQTSGYFVLKKLKNNLNYLLNENVQFKNEIKQLQSTIDICNIELNELRPVKDEISELNSQYSEQQQQNKELMETIIDLKNNNEILNKVKLELENKTTELDEEIESKQTQITIMTEKISLLQNEIDQFVHNLALVRNEMTNEVETLKQIEDKKNKIIINLEKKIMDQENGIEHLSKQYTKQIKLSRNKIKKLENEIEQQQNEIQSTTKIVQKYKRLNNELILHNEGLVNWIKDANKSRFELQKKLNEIFFENDTLEWDMNNLECVNEENEKEIRKIRNKMEQIKAEHLEEVQKLNETIKRNHSESHKHITKLENEKHELQIELETSKQNIIKLNEKLTKTFGDIDNLQAENLEFITKNSKLQKELQILENNYDESQQNNQNYIDKINLLKIKVNEIEILVNDTEKTIIAQRKQCIDLQEKFDQKEKEHLDKIQKSENSCNQLNRRLEKLSIQLGDSQANIKRMGKENEQLKQKHEQFNKLQKDMNKLKQEFDNMKKKYIDLQKIHDELIIKNRNLKSNNDILEENLAVNQKTITELQEQNVKEQCQMKDEIHQLSEKLAIMTEKLQNVEKENQNLTQQNSLFLKDIDKLFELFNITNRDEIYVICQQMQADNLNFKELCENLRSEINQSKEENEQISNKLSELTLSKNTIQQENEKIKIEIEQLKIDMENLQIEKQQLDNENLNTLTNLKELQLRQIEIIDEHVKLENELKEKIQDYEKMLSEKDIKINEIEIKQNQNDTEIEKKYQKIIDELKLQISVIEKNSNKEKEYIDKLQNDVEILRAKLIKSREMLEEKTKEWLNEKEQLLQTREVTESRIKDNRIELEGKLEKMKTKMKSLYNEEVAKLKIKHEREMSEFKHEIESLKLQNEKYESHTQKLSKQIFQLNDTNLELQKQTKFLETRLKDYESIPPPFSSNLRRKNNFTSSQGLNVNLPMEDEEGEMFNNTYLADLKSGRMSPVFGRDSISAQELKYRNSLVPPHLKSTYCAQYTDHNLAEEDIKDLPANFDDSLNSLLTGQRKKISGTTLYRKPGPPTPSKNAGRLSLGGISTGASGGGNTHSDSSHPREILKEINDGSLKRSTPSKFKLFSTSGKTKDESSEKSLRRRRKSNNVFASTPRQSKAHYDQRRQLEKFINESSFVSSSSSTQATPNKNDKFIEEIEKDKNDNDEVVKTKSLSFQPKNLDDKYFKWRQPKRTSTTDSCTTTPTTTDSNSPFVNKKTNINKDNQMFIDKLATPKNRKNSHRMSIYFGGNVMSSKKLPSNKMRQQLKIRSKYQRYANFNKHRKSLGAAEIYLRKSILSQDNEQQSITKKDICANIYEINNKDDEINRMSLQITDSGLIPDSNTEPKDYDFEQLLKSKISCAPFEIAKLHFTSNKPEIEINSPSLALIPVENNTLSCTTNTMDNCTTNTHSNLNTINTTASSRTTIYPGSVIKNRKIPSINIQMGRKMSMYWSSTNGRGIILFALMDLIVLWNSMSLLTKSVILFLLFAVILLLLKLIL